jgi:hypothetical protein
MSADRPPAYIIRQQRDAKKGDEARQATGAPGGETAVETAGSAMTYRPAPLKAGETRPSNPFPGYPTRPVSVDTLDGIEAVAFAIRDLHEAMTKLSPLYRVLATTMMSDEVAEILKMLHEDQRQYVAEPHRDLSPLITITPVEGPSAT